MEGTWALWLTGIPGKRSDARKLPDSWHPLRQLDPEKVGTWRPLLASLCPDGVTCPGSSPSRQPAFPPASVMENNSTGQAMQPIITSHIQICLVLFFKVFVISLLHKLRSYSDVDCSSKGFLKEVRLVPNGNRKWSCPKG